MNCQLNVMAPTNSPLNTRDPLLTFQLKSDSRKAWNSEWSEMCLCPLDSSAGCSEQSCYPRDLLRQPPPRAREPLCAAGDSDEPTGQDKVSETCSIYPAFLTQPMSSFSIRKYHSWSVIFIFMKIKVPPSIYWDIMISQSWVFFSTQELNN